MSDIAQTRDVDAPPRGIPHSRERGRIHSRFLFDTSETVPELTDSKRLETYRKMRRSDPTVSATLRSIELPIRQGTYDVTPPSKPTDTETEIAKRISEWLFEGLNWKQILRSSLTSLTYGFAVMEKVYDRVGKYIVPTKLGFRPQRTIEDERRNSRGELSYLIQRLESFRAELPRSKCVIISVDAESQEDWRGQSILRPIYKPWLIKEKMEIINAISHERFSAGVFILKAPERVLDEDKEWKIAEEGVKNLIAGLAPYAMLPNGWDLSILERNTRPVDLLPFIKELKDDIKTAPLALHLRLGGNDSSGSKALGVAFVDAFLHAVQAWADIVVDAYNDDLIKELVILNWGIQERYPRLTVTNIYKSALTELGYLMQTGIIKPTEELVRYIFEQYGIRIDPGEAVGDGTGNDPDNNGDGDDGIDNNAGSGD